MGTPPRRAAKPQPPEPDLRPYTGRWVALIRGHVAGVGLTADEARMAAKLSRPKEEPDVQFVPDNLAHSLQRKGDMQR